MKKNFNAAEIEVVKLDMVDIIATSSCGAADFSCTSDFSEVGGECTENDCLADFG